MQGVVGQWKGTYGFIRAGDKVIFVHFSDIAGAGYRELHPGEQVEFELSRDEQGRCRAMRVYVIQEAA